MSNPTKLAIIFAGEDHTATLLDGSTVAVRVRAMTARHLGRVLQLATQEAELLEFVCSAPVDLPADAQQAAGQTPAGQQARTVSGEPSGWQRVPEGWADNLTDESHLQLYEAAKRLNFLRAATWAERQIAAKQFSGEIAAKAEELMMPLVERMFEALSLRGSLLKPSAIPAPEATTRS